MSSISLMEWNAKTPLQWECDNLMMFNATPTEIPRKLRPVEWDFDGEEGMESGSLYSSSAAAAGGSGGSGSDLGLVSLSKSSKSASINSSSVGEVKATKFTLNSFEATPNDISNKKKICEVVHTGSSPTFEASVGSGEPLLSLKLGKGTYFEDVCTRSNANTSSYSATPAASFNSAKRSKSNCQSTPILRCQVKGCNLDLSSAKDYHRKHRVCESHSKSPKVIVGGLECRFCQQCSRFHGLSEFDEKKRSCRRRLSDHNARRRKPQAEAVHFSTARSSSTEYGAVESPVASNMGTTQDFHRALSLLSNESWVSCEPKQGSLAYPMHVNATSMSQPTTNAVSQSFPFPYALSENWQMEQQQTSQSQVQTSLHSDGDNHFQESRLLKTPYDSGFYSNQMN